VNREPGTSSSPFFPQAFQYPVDILTGARLRRLRSAALEERPPSADLRSGTSCLEAKATKKCKCFEERPPSARLEGKKLLWTQKFLGADVARIWWKDETLDRKLREHVSSLQDRHA